MRSCGPHCPARRQQCVFEREISRSPGQRCVSEGNQCRWSRQICCSEQENSPSEGQISHSEQQHSPSERHQCPSGKQISPFEGEICLRQWQFGGQGLRTAAPDSSAASKSGTTAPSATSTQQPMSDRRATGSDVGRRRWHEASDRQPDRPPSARSSCHALDAGQTGRSAAPAVGQRLRLAVSAERPLVIGVRDGCRPVAVYR